MSREDPQLRVRIPQELKDVLESRAKLNKRTLTAEIVDRLEATLEQDEIYIESTGYSRLHDDYYKYFREAEEWKKRYGETFKTELILSDSRELKEAIENLLEILNRGK